MNIHFVVFALGLFGVPLALLAYGHHLRKRPTRQRNVFWGAISGHILAGIVALISALMRPEAWTSQETLRGFLGMWSLVLLPALGALAGWLKPVRHNEPVRTRREDVIAPPSTAPGPARAVRRDPQG
jgi:hypothetical protein